MGSIRESATGMTVRLESEHFVGRAPTSSLRLSPRFVSAQQALIRWAAGGWTLRDLGSANGTFLDGDAIQAPKEYPLRRGSRIAFGDMQCEWVLVEDGPPAIMAVPLDGGPALVMDGELLALPSAEDPEATIYRTSGGNWVIEQLDESVLPLDHQSIFSCAGRAWRFCCEDAISKTTRVTPPPAEMHLQQLELKFNVSLDEEHVSIQVRCANRTFDLGERTHNYLLLTLARRRVADTQLGFPDTSCGWVDRDDLANDPRTPQLNVDVFRIRKQFAERGVIDAANVVERRPNELRIGTRKIAIARL